MHTKYYLNKRILQSLLHTSFSPLICLNHLLPSFSIILKHKRQITKGKVFKHCYDMTGVGKVTVCVLQNTSVHPVPEHTEGAFLWPLGLGSRWDSRTAWEALYQCRHTQAENLHSQSPCPSRPAGGTTGKWTNFCLQLWTAAILSMKIQYTIKTDGFYYIIYFLYCHYIYYINNVSDFAQL